MATDSGRYNDVHEASKEELMIRINGLLSDSFGKTHKDKTRKKKAKKNLLAKPKAPLSTKGSIQDNQGVTIMNMFVYGRSRIQK